MYFLKPEHAEIVIPECDTVSGDNIGLLEDLEFKHKINEQSLSTLHGMSLINLKITIGCGRTPTPWKYQVRKSGHYISLEVVYTRMRTSYIRHMY